MISLNDTTPQHAYAPWLLAKSDRRAPLEVVDGVMLWARNNGRRFGRVEFHPLLNCWTIHLGRAADDPMLAEYQEGRLEREPTESIFLREWRWNDSKKTDGGWAQMDLEEYGLEGVLAFLDQANLWSGQGEYPDLQSAIEASIAQDQQLREQMAEAAEEIGREAGWLHRNKILELPQVNVLANLSTDAADAAPSHQE